MMTNHNDTRLTAVAMTPKPKVTSISKDGKWKSFLNHAGLMQYVPSSVFFARAKVGGIVKRVSLETNVFTVAKDRLSAKLKELRKPPAEIGTFASGRVQFEAETRNKHELAELSRVYRLSTNSDAIPSMNLCLRRVDDSSLRLTWCKKNVMVEKNSRIANRKMLLCVNLVITPNHNGRLTKIRDAENRHGSTVCTVGRTDKRNCKTGRWLLCRSVKQNSQNHQYSKN
jgi:hypothetical protein